MSELLLNVVNDPNTDLTVEGVEADNSPTFLDEVIVERKPKKAKVETVEVDPSTTEVYIQD